MVTTTLTVQLSNNKSPIRALLQEEKAECREQCQENMLSLHVPFLACSRPESIRLLSNGQILRALSPTRVRIGRDRQHFNKNLLLPSLLRQLGLLLHGCSHRFATVREAVAAFGSKPPVFSRSSVHPCGLMQAWALWPGFCVCVCSCCSCPLCEARLWHPVPFPRCLPVWSRASLGRLCITAV